MTTPTKVHCFFEQSGTFKNEFRKLGIPAEDYARNFIADFILGKPCSDKVWQQADLFGDNNNNNERED